MPDAGRTGITEPPNEIEALVAQLGGDATATAAALSAALMTVVLLQFFTGSLADRYGRRLVLGSAALAGGFTSLGCALAASWSQLLVMRILGGVADAVAMPALLGLTVEISRGRQGTFLGPYARRRGCPSFWGLRSAAPSRSFPCLHPFSQMPVCPWLPVYYWWAWFPHKPCARTRRPQSHFSEA